MRYIVRYIVIVVDVNLSWRDRKDIENQADLQEISFTQVVDIKTFEIFSQHWLDANFSAALYIILISFWFQSRYTKTKSPVAIFL